MKQKNPFAVALGKLGGKKTVKRYTKEEMKERMRKVLAARWAKPGARKRASELANKNRPWEKRKAI